MLLYPVEHGYVTILKPFGVIRYLKLSFPSVDLHLVDLIFALYLSQVKSLVYKVIIKL